MMPQAVQLEQATSNYEVAKAQVAKTEESATQAEVAQALNQIAQAQSGLRNAQAQVVNAQNNLDNLLEGAKQEDIDIARAQVKQAQLNQLQAENTLTNARLVAPRGGVVSQVNVKEGELPDCRAGGRRAHRPEPVHHEGAGGRDRRAPGGGGPARAPERGCPARHRDHGQDHQDRAHVAANVNNVVAYEVTIVPDPTDAPLRAGMSATAIITTAEVDDVILVPNRYITLDRDTGKAYVYKMVDGQPVRQEVELGLRNERESQVLAGLQDGDVLALVTQSSEQQLRGALFGGGN